MLASSSLLAPPPLPTSSPRRRRQLGAAMPFASEAATSLSSERFGGQEATRTSRAGSPLVLALRLLAAFRAHWRQHWASSCRCRRTKSTSTVRVSQWPPTAARRSASSSSSLCVGTKLFGQWAPLCNRDQADERPHVAGELAPDLIGWPRTPTRCSQAERGPNGVRNHLASSSA